MATSNANNLLYQASALGIPYYNLTQDQIQAAVNNAQNSQAYSQGWSPNTAPSTAYQAPNNGGQDVTVPYQGYFNTGMAQQVDDLSIQMINALQAGDVPGYQKALSAYQGATGGLQPVWSQSITPAMVAANAGNPGGVGVNNAYGPQPQPTSAAVTNTGATGGQDPADIAKMQTAAQTGDWQGFQSAMNNYSSVTGQQPSQQMMAAYQQVVKGNDPGLASSMLQTALNPQPQPANSNSGLPVQPASRNITPTTNTGVPPSTQGTPLGGTNTGSNIPPSTVNGNPTGVGTGATIPTPSNPMPAGSRAPGNPGPTGQPSIPGQGQQIGGVPTPPNYGNTGATVPPPTNTQAGTANSAGPWGGPNLPMMGPNGTLQPNVIGINPDNLTYANLLANQATFSQATGLGLMGYDTNAIQAFNARQQGLAATSDQLTNYLLQNPGYSQDQANAIMDQTGLNALQYTPQEAQALALTPGETTVGVDPTTGQPGVYSDYSAMRNYFSPQVQQQMQNTVTGTNNAMNQAYQGGVSDVGNTLANSTAAINATIDPAQLGLSQQYQQNYQFTPEDQQAMVEAASRNVGLSTQAQQEQFQRQYAASGANAPLAEAAALNRYNQTGLSAAADAEVQAQIQAKQMALNTTQTAEATRLGAAQTEANLSNTSQQNIANRAVNTGLTQEQTGITTAQQEGAQQLANQQYTANTGMNLENTINQGQVAQAQWAASNRQAMTQWGQNQAFQQGQYADTAQSQRATGIAQAAKTDINNALTNVNQQEGLAQTGSQAANTAANTAFGATNASGAQALQTAGALQGIANQQPSLGSQIGAGIAGAAAGAASIPGLAKGGVITQPTVATVGEAGPEAIVPLSGPHYQPPSRTQSPFASRKLSPRSYSHAA